MLLDEAWLGGLLSGIQAPPASQHEEETVVTAPPPDALASPSREERRIEWGNAPDVLSFYGSEWEQDLLSEWVVEERCRVVSVLGQCGIGKSTLATKVMHRVAEDFEVVIWRSLRDVPSCEALLDDFLQVLAPQALRDASSNLESRQDLLLECLRSRRILLVYDNPESVLEEGEDSGRMRAGYEGFSRVLRWVAETEHQSCLLLTSREKPSELVPLKGNRAPARAGEPAGATGGAWRTREQSNPSRRVPMAERSPVAGAMALTPSGISRVASIGALCGVIGPTSDSTSQASKVFPRLKRHRWLPLGPSRKRALLGKCMLVSNN